MTALPIQETPKPAAKTCGCANPTCGKAAERPIRKILAAVDHPQHPALKMALKLAGPLHAQVAVVHVFEPLAVISTESAALYAEEMAEQLQIAKETVQTIEKDIPEQARAFACLREGTPSQEIITTAQEWDADLIVMGTHRRGALARVLLGSTSEHVVRLGKVPVMLVSDVETAAAKPKEK
jgi:nucleotide-binding universal stress UspA family protein